MIDKTLFKDKKAAYYTLGCKLNFSETSTIGRTLQEAGFRTVRRGEQADICVVNTCSVTEQADKKCRQAIHKLVKQHPHAFMVVTGCYAQLKPEQVAAIPGVDLVLGMDKKGELLEHLHSLEKREQGEMVTIPTKDIRTFVPSCSTKSSVELPSGELLIEAAELIMMASRWAVASVRALHAKEVVIMKSNPKSAIE